MEMVGMEANFRSRTLTEVLGLAPNTEIMCSCFGVNLMAPTMNGNNGSPSASVFMRWCQFDGPYNECADKFNLWIFFFCYTHIITRHEPIYYLMLFKY